MFDDEDSVRASRVLVDSLKANGVVQGKHSDSLAGITPHNRGLVFSAWKAAGHFLQSAALKELPATGLRYCARRRSHARIHGQYLPAISLVLSPWLAKFVQRAGIVSIVAPGVWATRSLHQRADQDDVFFGKGMPFLLVKKEAFRCYGGLSCF